MEKLIYTLWKSERQTAQQFCQQLLTATSDKLLQSGVHRLQISVDDDDVESGRALRQENNGRLMQAVVSLWVDSYIYRKRQETILAEAAGRLQGYLVTESEPINGQQCQTADGTRIPGMNQIAFLQCPKHLSREQWLDIWHNSHTKIAIETQSTFTYRQNTVVMRLTQDSHPIDAIVEEHFPMEALSSPHAFYDAVDSNGNNDDGKLKRHSQAMIESCMRFIDFNDINVLPTSAYLIKG